MCAAATCLQPVAAHARLCPACYRPHQDFVGFIGLSPGQKLKLNTIRLPGHESLIV